MRFVHDGSMNWFSFQYWTSLLVVLMWALPLYATEVSLPPLSPSDKAPAPFPVLDEIPRAPESRPVLRIPRPRRTDLEPATRYRQRFNLARVSRRPHFQEERIERKIPAPSFPTLRLSFLLFGDLDGGWVDPSCDQKERTAPFQALLRAIELEKERSNRRGEPAPIVLQTGNAVGNSPVARYLTQEEPTTWVKLATTLPADVYVPGQGEANLSPSLIQAMESERTGYFGSINMKRPWNLDARKEPDPSGKDLGYVLLAPSGIPVAVIPIAVGIEEQQGGLTFGAAPFREVSRAAAHARNVSGAVLVVGVASLGNIGDSTHRVVQLARRLQGVDLLFTGSQGDYSRGYGVNEIRFTSSDSPPILSRSGPPTEITRISVELIHQKGRFSLAKAYPDNGRALHPVELPPAPPMVQDLRRRYCAQWGQPLAHRREGSVDPEMWMETVGNIARWETETEISILSRDDLAVPPFTAIGLPLSRDAIERMHPGNTKMHVISMVGSELENWLKEVRKEADKETPFGPRTQGVKLGEDGLLINERALDTTHLYRLTVSDSILNGRTLGVPPLPKGSQRVEGASLPLLRDSIIDWVASPAYGITGSGESKGLPVFPDLRDAIQWQGALDTNLGFKLSAVENPANETQEPQLSRESFVGLESAVSARLDAQSRLHEWANRAELEFATSRAGGEAFSESKDITTAETLYSWLFIRNRVGNGVPWIPVPFSRLRLETELTVNEDSPFRHLEATGSVGARWLFSEKVRLSIGYGIGGEILDPKTNAPASADISLEVLRLPLTPKQDGPLFLEARTDITLKRPGSLNTLKALSSAKISYAWTPYLALTLGGEFFAYSTQGEPIGWSTDILVGIQGYFAGHAQTFLSP